jgi:hypothetical protein
VSSHESRPDSAHVSHSTDADLIRSIKSKLNLIKAAVKPEEKPAVAKRNESVYHGLTQLGLTDQELKFLSKKLFTMEKAQDSNKGIVKPDQGKNTVKQLKKVDGKKLKVASNLKKQVTEEALKAVRN